MPNTADSWTHHPLYTTPEFWSYGLRSPDFEICTHLQQHDPEKWRGEVARLLSRKPTARLVCRALGLDESGTVADLQERVLDHGMAIFPVLAARYSRGKRRAAIADAVRGLLTDDAQRECCHVAQDGNLGEPDPLPAMIRLYMHDPRSLRIVRALHLWHSSSAACMVLGTGLGALPRLDFGTFVRLDPAFKEALRAQESEVRFEGVFDRGDGQFLVFVSRDEKHDWMRIGGSVRHGQREELVVFDFQNGGRTVRVSSRSKPAPVEIANAIATAYFKRECVYTPDLAASADASVHAFMARVFDPLDHTLPLVDIDVAGSPGLAGEPSVALYNARGGRMEEAVQEYEHNLGTLVTRPEAVKRFRIRYDNASIALFVRRINGELVVQFADGRTNNHRAESFQRWMEREFSIQVRGARTSGR